MSTDPFLDGRRLSKSSSWGPSREGWRDLIQFVPDEQRYDRMRDTIALLRERDVDPNLLFFFATDIGILPDAIGLVEDGLIEPETIVVRAGESEGAQSFFWGLAAVAAFLRNDVVGMTRFLETSRASQNELTSPAAAARFIRERGSAEVLETLDKLGF